MYDRITYADLQICLYFGNAILLEILIFFNLFYKFMLALGCKIYRCLIFVRFSFFLVWDIGDSCLLARIVVFVCRTS